MKSILGMVLGFVAATAVAASTNFTVIARGADYKVWQKTTVEHGTNRVHKYTELATGMHYTNSAGQWLESREQITILPQGGAAATQGRHKVYFPSDIYNSVLEVITPDGKHLKSRPVGVSYDDGEKSVWIGKLKHCTGSLISSNKVLYPDAFTGVKADLLCTYRRGGFESDLIFREQPASPEKYGLDSSASTLQLFTEFFNTADPQEVPGAEDWDYGINDSSLKFGKMTMTRGKAFIVPRPSDGRGQGEGSTSVYKTWFHAENRTFLVEQVPLTYMTDDLQTLPTSTNILTSQIKSKDPILYVAQSERRFPPSHDIVKDAKPMLMASLDIDKRPGVVLDYNEIGMDQTDFTFYSGVTYFVSADYYLDGTTIFQGGTVLKFGGEEINNGLGCNGDVVCPADPANPAIFTSMDDDSVGETIEGSSGNPVAGPNFLSLNAAVSPLKNLRMSYANCCIITWSDAVLEISNSQFSHCENNNALDFYNNQTRLVLNNVLFSQCAAISYNDGTGDDGYIHGTHVTLDQSVYGACLGGSSLLAGEYCEAHFTNSIFTAIGDTNGVFLHDSVILTTGSGIYQSAANANYYLAANSPYRNAGTTAIDSGLLSELQTMTTYPPIVLSNLDITTDTIFFEHVPRDTDTPDLGYHYPAMDYALGGVSLEGATTTVYPGTVIGAFGTATRPYGLNLKAGAKFICKGLATNWNKIIACNTVQEGMGAGPMNGLITDDSGDRSSLIDCRFTDWSVLGPEAHLAISNHTSVVLRDCQFHGGDLFLDYPEIPPPATSISTKGPMVASDPALNNCLFENVNVYLHVGDGSVSSVENNLFRFGSFDYAPVDSSAIAQNNLFDQTAIPDNSSISGTYTGGYNAFLTGHDRLQPTSMNDLVLTTPVEFQTGPSGKYYQTTSSPLINAGAANANTLGLYDYTVLTNLVSGRQIKETNTVVDIGYHYVALDASGNPLDTDTNGLPDYLETSNQETVPDWWQWKYFGNLSQATNWDYDLDGTNILAEYLNGADPNKIAFTFSVPSQYISTNIVAAEIRVLSGVPSSIAILIDSTNIAAATWTAYNSSAVTLDIGTNQGTHDVWIGLRGLPADAQQTWQNTTLILDSLPPAISITNPVSNVSFNASRVNVSGTFTAATLRQITVNGVLAFTSGTNFEAVNVPLDVGTNVLTAIVEDFTGATNVSSITVFTTTNLDGSLSAPVQLSATPVAGTAPLQVTFQVQTNFPGTFQAAFYDWNGDGIADYATNNVSSVSYTYETNGEYFPVVTIQTTAGRFSSVGGWNVIAFDSEEPIRINVLPSFTQVQVVNITDPVDIKWMAPSNLYVLSGSTATLTQFTNGVSFRTLSGIGTAPSGFDVDSAGNVYIAVTASNQVWKLFPTNNTFAADTNFGVGGHIGLTNGLSGTNTNEFNAPFDVAVSPDGTMISVSDSGNHRISQFSAARGAFTSNFGTNGTAVGQFNAPKGLAYDSFGTLYIADSGNHRIVTSSGFVLSATGTNGTALGQFSNPVNLSVSERGVYVADTGNDRIQKFDAPFHGNFNITPSTTRFGFSTNFSGPKAVAAMNDFLEEKFWVADTGNNRVILYKLAMDDPSVVWAGMTNRIAAGDMTGASSYFSIAATEKYREAFLSIGGNEVISAISQIGTLTPAVIGDDTAQYYFEQTIDGQTITFPVEFVKENGTWKILEF